MFSYEISGSPEVINIRFRCPECGAEVDEDVVIPEPNFAAEKDTHEGTRNDEDYYPECPVCGRSFHIYTIGSCCASSIYIDNLDSRYSVDINCKYEND